MRVSKEKQERRLELIEVAERLFLTRGYAATAVSDIVREAGVAQGTFYYHFKSKDDVLIAVVQKTAARLEEQLRAIAEDANTGYRERVQAILRTAFRYASDRRDLIEFIHQDSNALLHHRLMGTTVMVMRRYLTALVEEGARHGEFDVAHPQETVDFFLGGLGGMLHLPGMTEDPERTERFRHAAEIALERSLGLKA